MNTRTNDFSYPLGTLRQELKKRKAVLDRTLARPTPFVTPEDISALMDIIAQYEAAIKLLEE